MESTWMIRRSPSVGRGEREERPRSNAQDFRGVRPGFFRGVRLGFWIQRTRATLHSGDETLHRVVGPAISRTSGWVLPVLCWFVDPTSRLSEYKQEARKLRNEWGLEAALS